MRAWMVGLLAMAGGCSGGEKECGPAECAGVCAAEAPAEVAAAPALTAFEHQLLDPALEDVRGGVRPFAEGVVGICKGQGKECEEFLGLTPGELPPGKYMLRGEYRVPRVGAAGTWKLRLERECTITRTTEDGTVTTNRSGSGKDYDMIYTGEDRGYRLSPMVVIDSPSPVGAQSCTFSLIAVHPDGNSRIEGSWSVPQG